MCVGFLYTDVMNVFLVLSISTSRNLEFLLFSIPCGCGRTYIGRPLPIRIEEHKKIAQGGELVRFKINTYEARLTAYNEINATYYTKGNTGKREKSKQQPS